MIRPLAIFLILATTLPCAADDTTARTIMERVDARNDGDGLIAEMEMILIDRRGNERRRTIRSFTKDRGADTLQVMFFLYPPDVAGTGFLTHDFDDADHDDDQWLYLPALGKTKRIASSSKSGSFMGSDFNYSDLASRDLDDFEYRLVKEDEVRGHPVWVIESIPISQQVIDETGYEKALLLVRKDIDFVIRAVSWVQGGEDLRYLDVVGLEEIDDIWVATAMTMTTKRSGEIRHATRLTMSNVRFNQKIDDSMFTLRSLETGP